ncbi:MAG: ATP-binding cassette domain-containing protein [bacterium]
MSFRFKALGASPRNALDRVDLEIESGEFLALVGASGSGKTTLMQHLTGLLQPDQGRVLIDGVDLRAKSTRLDQIRRRVGLVFQFPESQLFETTVYDDVAFGPRNLELTDQEIEHRVRQALQLVALNFQQFKERSPLFLSEGEKRRVAIAGIIAMQPEFLALDEPTAGLDYSGVQAVTKIMKSLHARGTSILLISHSLELVAALVPRVVVLRAGKIIFDGTPTELFDQPGVLQATGLEVPRIQKLAKMLRERGWIDSNETCFDLPKLKQALARKSSAQPN